jgi:hypothetical protein
MRRFAAMISLLLIPAALCAAPAGRCLAEVANAPFGGKGFEIRDEVFQFQKPWSRQDLHVLLSIDTDKTDMDPKRRFLPERCADKGFAISWVKSCGKGRVFYTSLGHNQHIFWNAPVLEHFLAGIQFALGDLPASNTPNEIVQSNP